MATTGPTPPTEQRPVSAGDWAQQHPGATRCTHLNGLSRWPYAQRCTGQAAPGTHTCPAHTQETKPCPR